MRETSKAVEKMKGILTDVTKCIGCELCVEACVRVNKLGPDLPFRTTRGDGLSGRRLTAIVKIPGTERSVRRHCLHCLEPSCVAACLVGALSKRPDGPVVYDPKKCIGCRYCMLACPFEIPRYEWDSPLPYVRKCKMNEECQVEGGVPACVAACPTGATIFGERDELLRAARRRIQAHPELYLPRIYGAQEMGGTCVLYVSDVPLEEALKFPDNDKLRRQAVPSLEEESIPRLVSPWIKLTPVQAAGVMAGLGLTWFIRRRQALMSARGPRDRGSGEAPGPGAAGLDEVCPSDDERREEGQ